VAFSPQANYTDRRPPLAGEFSAKFCGENVVPWSLRRVPTAINVGFLDRSRYFSFNSGSIPGAAKFSV
jgi:hypothetical protein